MRLPQGLHINLAPDPKLLAQALVAHLQRGDIETLALVGLKARHDVFPGQALGLLELHQEAVILAEFGGDAVGPVALLTAAVRGHGTFFFVAAAFEGLSYHAGGIRRDLLEGPAGHGLGEGGR